MAISALIKPMTNLLKGGKKPEGPDLPDLPNKKPGIDMPDTGKLNKLDIDSPDLKKTDWTDLSSLGGNVKKLLEEGIGGFNKTGKFDLDGLKSAFSSMYSGGGKELMEMAFDKFVKDGFGEGMTGSLEKLAKTGFQEMGMDDAKNFGTLIFNLAKMVV